MFDTKLIQVLRCFDGKETKKLYEYLESPFFSKSEKSMRLLYYVKPYLPALDSPNLSKEKTHQALFPQTPYNNLRFNRICFEAMETVEDFLRHYYLHTTDAHVNKPVFDFYIKHQLDKHFEALHKSLEVINDRSTERNEKYLFQKWLLAATLHLQKTTQSMRGQMDVFKDMMLGLNDFYITKWLEYMCVFVSLKNIGSNQEHNFMEKELMQYLAELPIQSAIPAIQIPYHTYLMQKEDDISLCVSHFERVSQLNVEYGHLFNAAQRINIYISLQNFCIRQINKRGDVVYKQKLFALYQEQLAAELVYDESANFIPAHFKNIVQLGLLLMEYEWTANFIEIYSSRLNPEQRFDVENHARASYAFATGAYSTTLKILQNIELNDIFFKLDAKRLLIRAYYELTEYELALSTLNSLKVFVHRDNLISETHKHSNRNFTNILIKLILAEKTAKVAKIKEELIALQHVADRKWLTEKVNLRLI